MTTATQTHTPGDWITIHDEEAGKHKVFGPLNEYIATLDAVLEGKPHTRKNAANARLMAAAPELLEALRKIATADISDGMVRYELKEIARAAIEKVEKG